MEDLLGQSTADRRFNVVLIVAFAVLAMLLAAVGLFGMVSMPCRSGRPRLASAWRSGPRTPTSVD